MKKAIAIIVFGLLLSGNAYADHVEKKKLKKLNYQRLAEYNKTHLLLVEPGMSKKEVLEIMGTETFKNSYKITNPLHSAVVEHDGVNYSILYYYTKRGRGQWAENVLLNFSYDLKHEATPLVFINRKLKGYGNAFIEPLLRELSKKYDFEIKIE